jgi:hypothetical protein
MMLTMTVGKRKRKKSNLVDLKSKLARSLWPASPVFWQAGELRKGKGDQSNAYDNSV